ncbi:MAG: mechanosensitive ion channel, partial [Planctomycetales bacterium]|nr:mechanosensitive ion channel [Planctomycetales bacterium]
TASSNPAEAASLAAALRLAQQESKLASAKLDGVQLELANVKLEEETLQLQIQQLTEKLSIISQEVSFSIEDLNEKLRELSRATSKIVRKQEENEAEVTIRMSGWKNAQQRLDNAPEPSAAMQAELEARRWAYHLRKNRADFLARQNQWLQTLREVWRRRYNVATEQFETAQLVEWGAAAVTFSEELATEKTIQLARVEDLRKILAETERVVAQDGLPEVERWLGEQANVIREQIDFLNNHISNLEVAERTNQKLIQEIRSRTSSFSVAEWGRLIWSKIGLVWDYELMKTEDDQPLRVSAVVTGLLLLILGYRVSKWASSTLGNRVLTHFGINEGGAAALQSLSFYALLFTSTLMALKVVSVPLTLFTFLGGAAAIGLGFGSQNILNNFISGLILLTEQPIRVGDLIELNGLTGCVESIGMRSTRVRTGSNCEIIVPNSSFLENNVVNWTLADSVVRCEVRVGVSYGSPTRDVARWLKYAAVEHGLVLKKPEPFVWFAGFGDNSLDFELYFFITVRTLSERRRIESDLRFMVDQYFREAGICIAFPQRDIHLDTQKPLEVRMLPAENDATQQTGHSARDGQQAA